MPRSAIDATRFTSTTPYASAKPPPSASSMPLQSLPLRTPGPAGETPKQKVIRLRAAAQKARDAKVTMFDRMIIHGRVWADRAHRFTALSLIGITGIAGVVTVYALGDMMIYNRRKRAEFFAEQRAIHSTAAFNAQKAIRLGTATEDQINLIEQENIRKAQIEEAKNKKSIFARGTEWFFSGLKKEEEGEDVGTAERRLGYEGLNEEDDGLGERESDILRAIEDKKSAVKEKTKRAFAREKERERVGGPLDGLRTASESSGEEAPKSRGWTSFMTRR